MSKKRVHSIKKELLIKSREAQLAAIQIYNNPNITFKSESFIVLSIISWTYLLHAYYRGGNIDYRYFEKKVKRKRYSRTKNGSYKYWELERCLNDSNSPLDKYCTANLKFLIGIRHEIEHQMTNRIDEVISAKLQASVLNYNENIIKLFGEQYSISKYLTLTLQLRNIQEEQLCDSFEYSIIPKNVAAFIKNYDESLEDDVYNNKIYSYRVIFIQRLVNNKGNADKVIEFVKPGSKLEHDINKQLVVKREVEKKKYLPGDVVQIIQKKYPNFTMHNHTMIWKEKKLRNPAKGYGVYVVKKWYWYDTWIEFLFELLKTETEHTHYPRPNAN